MSNRQTAKTKKTFKEKWENNPDLAFRETLKEGSDIFCWILNRNGFKTAQDLTKYLKGKKRILDAGCGNGRVTALLRRYAPKETEIVGVDLEPSKIAQQNLENAGLMENVKFFKRDLMDDLSDLGKFDFIYCQEVLHHLTDPELAFRHLVKLLSPDGEIAIYVYKEKAPIREFADDYVRDKISEMPYAQAMKICEEITLLGKNLAQKKIKIKMPKVEVLAIEAGDYDLQRFIYHFFMKCFWNPDLTLQENVAINYDWYHPQICQRYTVEAIRAWFKKAKLKSNHECVDYYGITMKGKK